MRLSELLRNYQDRDSKIILAHLLGVKPSQLYLLEDRELSDSKFKRFMDMIEERGKGTPAAYLIGEWECMGRSFELRRGILVPRPETEILIEVLLGTLPHSKALKGYEIGLGSGCISINLLLERKKLEMWGSDINPLALELSVKNAKRYRVDERLHVLSGRDFEPVKGQKFDFVVSNPPYIPEIMWDNLPKEVKAEGKEALIGGEKGYEFYERVSRELREHLSDEGVVAFEIGHDQGEVVKSLLGEEGFEVNIYRDYNGQDRVIVGWKY